MTTFLQHSCFIINLAPKRSCATQKPTVRPTASEFGPKRDVYLRVGTSCQVVPSSGSDHKRFYCQSSESKLVEEKEEQRRGRAGEAMMSHPAGCH